ncbi:undecaprenyldiphospho-muramoylpentapeptide beta-N-acetylglucosaminyltransferase [Candidatus Tisiphia endosymbiont of Neophilaenus lineatus]|uniref:undecaprenyldiphospho-muramoylpentapeptide beta-N-acetylglucosaminyltransferase n=1 Tax=Candidatus Tisiphia endosymbiont of Neophilaenus lineatus TaxID=3139336 RepID=UPI0035C95E3A
MKNRLLAEFASAEEFKEATERRTAAYSSVREDSSTGATNKLPAEVELCKKSNIIVAGGGTAGHLFPAIALGEELMQRGYELHLITDVRCQKYLTEDLKLIPHIINFRLAPKGLINRFKLLISLLFVTFKMLLLLVKIKPYAIIGFGGYPTFPPLLAAVFLRIPIIVYEQNCFIGKANRFFLKYARKVALTYDETKNYNILDKNKKLVIGNIVRENVKNLKVRENFNNDTFRIFIFGGSQGAKVLSTLIPEAIQILVQSNPDIKLHITQQASLEDHDNIAKIYAQLKIPYKLADFFYDMEQQYASQELVISRAGASTISELCYVGLPAIFIPLPSASENHQFYNAKALEDSGAGWCFEQSTITAEKLADKILVLVKNRDILKKTSIELLKRKHDGSKVLADAVEEIIS